MEKKVAIIMGSDSDLPTMKEAAEALQQFGLEYDLTVVSAHRTPDRMYEFAKSAHEKYSVIIAGAGGAAHLPGMVAALTRVPVIGVPIKSSMLSGVDSLYSIVQMPPGVVVATVAIGKGFNAGLLAAEILALSDNVLAKKVDDYRRTNEEKVIAKAKKLESEGWEKYLKGMDTK